MTEPILALVFANNFAASAIFAVLLAQKFWQEALAHAAGAARLPEEPLPNVRHARPAARREHRHGVRFPAETPSEALTAVADGA